MEPDVGLHLTMTWSETKSWVFNRITQAPLFYDFNVDGVSPLFITRSPPPPDFYNSGTYILPDEL